MEDSSQAVFSTLLTDLSTGHPGHSELLQILCSFLQADAVPGFIHVHAPISTRHTQQVIQTLLECISSSENTDSGPFLYSFLNGIECFSSRLFYHRILQTILKQHKEDPIIIPPEDIQQYTSDLGNFLRALRFISRKSGAKNIIIVLDCAEKLKESLPELWTPLSRLDELAGIPLSVITISQASWFELRPLDGSAIHPLLINVKPYSKKDSQTFLTSLFPFRSNPSLSPYNPALKPLFSHFIAAVINICHAFLIDELELGYIASACWPIFVQPILNQWKRAESDSHHELPGSPQLDLPGEDARIRLTKYFTPLIANALEMLYPRTKHIKQWIQENAFPKDVTLSDILQTSSIYQAKSAESSTATTNSSSSTSHHYVRTRENQNQIPLHIRSLTTIAKFILIAAFLASHNPHKSDLKLFGRGINDMGRRRKKGGGTARPRIGVVGSRNKAKVSQKLLGPMAFPLDRLVAIVGSLMEEHYVEQEDEDDPDRDENKDIEMVVGRVQVSATITELVNQGLLNRITPEKNDLEAMTYKSTINHSCAFALAREVGIGSLLDYMYDAEG